MTERLILLALILFFAVLSLGAVDLSIPREYLDAFMRTRGDTSGSEVVYHWTGKIYSFVPGEARKELFGFEGFSIARTVSVEGGYQLLTREAAFFLEPRSGEILSQWRNPFTGKDVEVVHIWNDPVNQEFVFNEEEIRFISKILPSETLGDELVFYMDIFPFYDSPLPRRDYSAFSQHDKYQAAEFFQFFVDLDALNDPQRTSVPASISWTRISPWMPFMRMGNKPGNLVFQCRGRKLEGGFEALPVDIRDYVMANNPQFASAPTEFTEPNETSWTYFRKLVQQGLIK
jgi:hypothetical protein